MKTKNVERLSYKKIGNTRGYAKNLCYYNCEKLTILYCMKILFTSHKFYPNVGGIEVNSEILASYFQSKGHEVKLITQTKHKKKDSHSYEVYRQPSIIQMFKLYAWSDIVYQNNIELRSLWPIILINRPFVISIRTWLRGTDGKRRMIDYIKIIVLQFAENVIAVSSAIQKDSFKKSIVIGNPYRSKLFRELKDIKRNRSVAYLGRFVSDKGVELLIKSYSRLELHNEEITLIGSGPSKKEYIDLADNMGVKLNLTGLLHGESLVEELNRHKILVIPSLWEEPFGNVALEGMACGCIILAANGGGLTDAVGNAGLLFERGNIDDLTKKLKNIYYDDNIKMKLDIEIERHLKKHTKENICARYLNILVTSLGQSLLDPNS